MPFGEELFINVGSRLEAMKYGTSADAVRQKFTGYQNDEETGLDFAEARMYQNLHGRFTAVDPLYDGLGHDDHKYLRQSWPRKDSQLF